VKLLEEQWLHHRLTGPRIDRRKIGPGACSAFVRASTADRKHRVGKRVSSEDAIRRIPEVISCQLHLGLRPRFEFAG